MCCCPCLGHEPAAPHRQAAGVACALDPWPHLLALATCASASARRAVPPAGRQRSSDHTTPARRRNSAPDAAGKQRARVRAWLLLFCQWGWGRGSRQARAAGTGQAAQLARLWQAHVRSGSAAGEHAAQGTTGGCPLVCRGRHAEPLACWPDCRCSCTKPSRLGAACSAAGGVSSPHPHCGLAAHAAAGRLHALQRHTCKCHRI